MPDAESDPVFESARHLFVDGLAAFHAGRFEDAERCFVASLAAVPGRAPTLLNLAVTRLELGRPVEAIAATDAVLAARADDSNALSLRARALARLGLHDQALAACDRVLAVEPGLTEVWTQRGGLLRETGRLAEAAQAFEQAIASGGDPELNGFYLAAVRSAAPPCAAPEPYVEGLFDAYSAGFEQHLVGVLDYRAHIVLADNLQGLGARPFASALDLGCGTGLCGPLVRPQVTRLTGIDLARRMLDQARALGVYDRLERAEGVAWLASSGESFDLIVCADVVVYIGDLSPLFEALRQGLARGGVFCFSAERASREGAGFELLPSLRYAHSEHYLRELASRHGFEVARLLHAPIREDQQQPVDGLYCYLTRP